MEESSSSARGRVKRGCLWFGVSLREGFLYVKAFLVGQVKKMKAKNEREATEANLTETKMQVEATDEAENAKKRLHM
ncbi:PREDICTED: uncharacterized protein LOC104806901 [Tarenaya hassleriana]|uniref:uncharacterized protein LOC104806901 n=1 Tax=Tarenaya hassleriana TaxID=28532 RepID=UPI00053C5529|nr:PREDICTED: uncharacterized protein LOC104806901 [Tarenaya hassleriana]